MSLKNKNSDPQLEEKIERCVQRIASRKEEDYFRSFLRDLIHNNIIPISLLEEIPIAPGRAKKTRFDQLYDAAMFLAFPIYSEEALNKLLGPEPGKNGREVRIWRVLFPPKFGLSHVLIRAQNFQEAFALGCDYACRLSLMVYRRIPSDLTVRIQFVSDKGVRRMLDMRAANKLNKRKKLQLVGRSHSYKEVLGARAVAIGLPGTQEYGIAKYVEWADLRKLMKEQDIVRATSVETETFRRKKPLPADRM